MAEQELKIKGYEHFETTTDTAGNFKFSQLLPNGKYKIITLSTIWSNNHFDIELGSDGIVITLDLPVILRYKVSKDGVITDTKTGLQWAQSTNSKNTWLEANAYVRDLRLGGYNDWRLPTRGELKGLYEAAKKHKPYGRENEDLDTIKIDRVFKLKDYYVWSSELKDTSSAWFFSFSIIGESWGPHNSSSFINHVLAVRP